jgi:iron complex outermembrane receptor protein
MMENREGGTMLGSVVGDGSPFREELKTRRIDGGMVAKLLAGQKIVSIRASGVTQRHRHQFDEVWSATGIILFSEKRL